MIQVQFSNGASQQYNSNQNTRSIQQQCSQFINAPVQLFKDPYCQQPLNLDYPIQQQQIFNNILYAQVDNNYDEITCWFILDGQEQTNGVSLPSDYTFEEILNNAVELRILQKVPEKIIVANQSGEELTTTKEMQMMKFQQPGKKQDYFIHLRSDGGVIQVGAIKNSPEKSVLLTQYQKSQQFNFNIQNNIKQFNISQDFQQNDKCNSNQKAIPPQNQQIINLMNDFIVFKRITFAIHPSGEQVIFKYHIPLNISGILKQKDGKQYQTKYNQYKWKQDSKNGLSYAEIDEFGIAIKWRNNTVSSFRVKVQS